MEDKLPRRDGRIKTGNGMWIGGKARKRGMGKEWRRIKEVKKKGSRKGLGQPQTKFLDLPCETGCPISQILTETLLTTTSSNL